MQSIPASVAIVGVATLLVAATVLPATVSAADCCVAAAQSPAVFPYAYTAHENDHAGSVHTVDDERDPYRYTRERIWPGYGGARIEHHFGIHPDDPERPRYRKYYPYVWGGYAFSAPYFVKRHEYSRPEYDKPVYGKAQKYRWSRDYKRPSQWEDGRW